MFDKAFQNNLIQLIKKQNQLLESQNQLLEDIKNKLEKGE